MLLPRTSLLEGSTLTAVPETVTAEPPGVIFLPSTNKPEGSAAKIAPLIVKLEGAEGLTTLATSMVSLSTTT